MVWFEGKRISNPNTHGTGCTLSSAIASGLAKGMTDAHEVVKEIIEKLSIIFNIIDLKFDDLKKATILNIEDYEDAIQSAQASRIKANYIITRNVKDYNNSKISAIKPSELIDRL